MFCCTLLCVRSSIVIILVGKRELVALLNLSSWCLVMVERLFLAMPQGFLRFVIVVFPDHTHLLFLNKKMHHYTAKYVLKVYIKYHFVIVLDLMSLSGTWYQQFRYVVSVILFNALYIRTALS